MIKFCIGGVKKTSLLDYPNKISAIVFTKGCNFNCGFCHNPGLIRNETNEDEVKVTSFLNFLETRKGKLEGVVITGGEPTLQKDLKLFIKEIKDMNFSVKLDTNGYKPEILDELLNENLIDYIAMDIKAPKEKYSFVTGIEINMEKIEKSIDIIMKSGIDYEFRTTFMPYYHSIQDFEEIGKLIKRARIYYLQKFEARTEINNEKLKEEKNFSNKDINEIINILKPYVKDIKLR